MKTHHTAIIVGGGPAGSAAAYTLARQGIDNCIVDKAVFPRDKLCGGLLTLRSEKIFKKVFAGSWESVIEHRSHGVKFIYQGRLLNHIENYSELLFTQRINFDNYLLNLAGTKGTAIYQGKALAGIDMNQKICRLRSGEEISYDYLVGADGVNSAVAKALFGSSFDKQTVAFAVEVEIDKQCCKRTVREPEIHFGAVRWGYGWIFPKRQTLTVGLGGLHRANPDIKEVFKQFISRHFVADTDVAIKGHYLPFGCYRKTPGAANVLLAGDAAGLVDPITGEGIALAMESGHMAALAIEESIQAGPKTDVLEGYKKKYTDITRGLDHANRLRYLIFPRLSEYLFIKALPKSKTLPQKHLDLMADNINYNDYTKYVLGGLLKSLAKRV